MTHVENIHPGDWVLIVSNRCKLCGGDHEEHVGVPFRVLAVELPFLLLGFPDGDAKGLDTRDWGVKKIGTARNPGLYVRRWYAANVERADDDQECEERRPTDGHPRCVKCGERLRQTQRGKSREWRWLCPTPKCGYDGGPVEVAK